MAAAASPKAVIHQLTIQPLFDRLTRNEKLYAHHLSKAAWHGGRILMRQVSPEGPAIFDFIMSLHQTCHGDWMKLAEETGVSADDLRSFLDYAAQFLCNMGNFYGSGDMKFVPGLSQECLQKLAASSSEASQLLGKIIKPMFSMPPYAIGYPDDRNQSGYYLGERVTRDEVAGISRVAERHQLELENTRLRKFREGSSQVIFDILQSSVETDQKPLELDEIHGAKVRVVRGDHASELSKVSSALREAETYAANGKQAETIRELIQSFDSGSLDAVETIIGFVEPIRDPHGVRAEWEGIITISDVEESVKLKELVESSTKFVRMFPWAVEGVNDGKGPFEPTRFGAPDFAIVHALAFCSSCVWDAVKLPNYLDIRENCGYKNLMFANRMSTYSNPSHTCPFVYPSEYEKFRKSFCLVRFVMNAIHELLGHGSGKLLSETSPGKFNFDKDHPPTNPLTGRPVDIIYHTYLFFAVEGILGLQFYDSEGKSWGQPHRRASFAILKHLLLDGGGVVSVEHDLAKKSLYVRVDCAKLLSHGKPSVGRLMTKIHIWRCTADIQSCDELYGPLTTVDGVYEEWRQIVAAHPEPQAMFVQANTFLDGDGVRIKVYDETSEGVIQSFAERGC